MITYREDGQWFCELDDSDDEKIEIISQLERNITDESYNDEVTIWLTSNVTGAPVDFRVKISDYLTPKEYLLLNFDKVDEIFLNESHSVYLAKIDGSSDTLVFEYRDSDLKYLTSIKW